MAFFLYQRGYKEVHLVYEMNYGVHLLINQQLIENEGNYTCIYLIWKMGSIRQVMEYGILSYNIIYQEVNGSVKVMGMLCYLHEHLLAKWKRVKRFYVYNGLVGMKRKVYYLSFKTFAHNVLVRLLYGYKMTLTSRTNGSKGRVCDYQGFVVYLIVVVAWRFWEFVIKLLGIFKPQSTGSTEQCIYYFI